MAKTLLELSGHHNKTINWFDCNLLMIDMQNQYLTGDLDLKMAGKNAIYNAGRLLKFARDNNINIFHIMHVGGVNSPLFNPDSDNVKIIDLLMPQPNENIIQKQFPNAFHHTNLYQLLKETGKTQLIIIGFASHMCVTATTIAAFELGFDNFICVDCCASRDIPFFSEDMSANIMHKATMALLGDRYATLTTSNSIMS